MAPHDGGWRRSAPFSGRLRNLRIDAFGTTYGPICPTVFDGDMTVIWQDAIPIPAHFPSKSGRLWATRRLLLCTAVCVHVRISDAGLGSYSCSQPALGMAMYTRTYVTVHMCMHAHAYAYDAGVCVLRTRARVYVSQQGAHSHRCVAIHTPAP